MATCVIAILHEFDDESGNDLLKTNKTGIS
jgi:hypothetical protein